MWGAATSAHQIEGDNKHNDWWEWEKKKFRKDKNKQSGRAAGHYTRYKTDIKLVADFGHNAHRFSIEWSRVEPECGTWDELAIRHYKQVLQELKKYNITTMVTLHHFTTPLWLTKRGGWVNRRSPYYFERYAMKMHEAFDGLVDFWITINEPMIYVSNSFMQGMWPPQKKSVFKARRVLINMVKAHKRVWRSMTNRCHRGDQPCPKIGIAQNIFDFHSYNLYTITDYLIIRFLHWAVNIRFLKKIKRHMNFIGVNYYFHTRIRRSKKGFFKLETIDIREEDREASDMNWEVYPQGIFEALLALRHFKMPVYVTENGIATTNDHKRIRFLIGHLKEVYHAIQAGVDVQGYFYWSLLDNFEWDKGFWPRFGLVEVDYRTLKRTPRQSALVYKKICTENGIAHELLRFVGHGVRWNEDDRRATCVYE